MSSPYLRAYNMGADMLDRLPPTLKISLLALQQIHLLFQQNWSHFELYFVSMNMFLDETSTLDTSYTASGLQFVIRLCTPNEYVHTGQAHANVCKLQIKRGITRCRLTPTFVFKRKF